MNITSKCYFASNLFYLVSLMQFFCIRCFLCASFFSEMGMSCSSYTSDLLYSVLEFVYVIISSQYVYLQCRQLIMGKWSTMWLFTKKSVTGALIGLTISDRYGFIVPVTGSSMHPTFSACDSRFPGYLKGISLWKGFRLKLIHGENVFHIKKIVNRFFCLLVLTTPS